MIFAPEILQHRKSAYVSLLLIHKVYTIFANGWLMIDWYWLNFSIFDDWCMYGAWLITLCMKDGWWLMLRWMIDLGMIDVGMIDE